MLEIIVFAEDPTEERFIKQVVAPALHGSQLYLKPQLLNTSQTGRGGALSIDRFLLNASNTRRQKPDAVLSLETMQRECAHFRGWMDGLRGLAQP